MTAAKRENRLLNGTRVWAAGAVTARMFTQSQTSPVIGAKTETKERTKEPNSEKGENMEQILTVQYSETNVEFASKMTKVEEELETATRQDRVEDPQQKAEGGRVLTTDAEHKPGPLLGYQHNTTEAARPVKKTPIRSPGLESVAPSEHRLQRTTSPVEEQNDCWDKHDFLFPDIDENSKLPFGFLSSNTETRPLSFSECAQPHPRFPARPVVTRAMPHPQLLFNATYFYPPSTFEGDQNAFTGVI